MMMNRIFVAASLFSTLIRASQSPLATQTLPASEAANSPQEPVPQPTSPPHLNHDLLRRQASNSQTCGYTNGNFNSPNVCGTGSICGFYTSPNSYFGCCEYTSSSFGSDCFQVATCMPWSAASAAGSTNAGAFIDGNTVVCGSSGPNCATTFYNDAESDQYTHYDCVTAAAFEVTLSQNAATTGSMQSVVAAGSTASLTSQTEAMSTVTEISVSVVRVTVSPHTQPVTSATTTTSSPTSSASASAATTAGHGAGVVHRANAGLAGFAVVAWYFGIR